jgi:hypothetical protein
VSTRKPNDRFRGRFWHAERYAPLSRARYTAPARRHGARQPSRCDWWCAEVMLVRSRRRGLSCTQTRPLSMGSALCVFEQLTRNIHRHYRSTPIPGMDGMPFPNSDLTNAHQRVTRAAELLDLQHALVQKFASRRERHERCRGHLQAFRRCGGLWRPTRRASARSRTK